MANSGTVVTKRNARQIENLAATVRRHLGVAPDARISMQPVLENMLDAIFEDAYFAIDEDRNMHGAEARTALHAPVITVSRSTYEALERSEPRARMTVAHEIGHLLMHCGRRDGDLHRSDTYDPRRDPEWQADMFAAALLMPKPAFMKSTSICEAMRAFGVSRSAVSIRARMLKQEPILKEVEKGKKRAAKKRRP